MRTLPSQPNQIKFATVGAVIGTCACGGISPSSDIFSMQGDSTHKFPWSQSHHNCADSVYLLNNEFSLHLLVPCLNMSSLQVI